ncbi:MAG: cytochrome b [Burkholderiaceae bacterium]|nr:MAG: cytochrome b [Burkholderiaceae bacterium]
MTRYTLPAIVLHWLMALLIIWAFTLGLRMVDMPGLTPDKLKYFSWHKWLGVTVLGLACVRLLWRVFHPAPAYPASMPRWQQKAANGLHAFLYLLIFIVPLSGYFYSLADGVPVVYLGVIPLPVLMEKNAVWKPILKELHDTLTTVLLVVFCLHVLAALKHHFIDKDGIFKRMWL